MNINKVVEKACDRAEFNKAYEIRSAVGELLSLLESMPIQQYGASDDVKGDLEELEDVMEDVMYNTFSALDQDREHEFYEFLEAVRDRQ